MLITLPGVIALLLGLGKLRPPNACTTFAAPRNEDRQNSQLLNLNTPVKREIQGGELHAYAFPVNAHDYVRILIVSQGVEPEITIASAAGQTYVKRNGRRREPTPISVIATESGTLAINVRSLEP